MRSLLSAARLHALVLSTLALGCGSPARDLEPPPAEESTSGSVEVAAPEPVAAEPIPEGPLPEGVTPLRYALDLEVVPSRVGFSGTVDVRVRLDHPTQRIWMHGTGTEVREAWVVPGIEGDLANGPLTASTLALRICPDAHARIAAAGTDGHRAAARGDPRGAGEAVAAGGAARAQGRWRLIERTHHADAGPQWRSPRLHRRPFPSTIGSS